jgi:hypothetical protein
MNSKETRKKMLPLCQCPHCPTYVDCKEEVAFCLADGGKSKCIKIQNGCLCGGCPVEQQMRFEHMYYCVLGSEKEQS